MARCTERRQKQKCNNKKLSIDKVMMNEAREYFKKFKNDVTREAYEKNYKRYICYCRKYHNSKSKEDCSKFIQEYADYLKEQGKTASTIHTYIAPICSFHGISMSEITKPIRRVSENIRSRERANKYQHTQQRYGNPKYSYVAEIQTRTGIRRSELMRLCMDDLIQDEIGYAIRIKRGKGGRFHKQRLNFSEDIEFVKQYFNKSNSNERLFKKEDFSPKMDYHHLRALFAQKNYKFYYDLLHTGNEKLDQKNRQKLIGDLLATWNKYNLNPKTGIPRPFPFKNTKGVYKLRGATKKKAIEDGFDIEFDRLALFATNVFCLAHWRLSASNNYLLAK
ncbi:MAG: hypothetical protein IIU80_02960 [Clostridia bacterium]|nr:hypothetical protein [Clostridia bacterium]